jgi:uncharacterized membrane protein
MMLTIKDDFPNIELISPYGGSALFFIVRGDDIAAALAAIRPYKGTLYQTTLPSDLELELRNALK